MENLGVLDVVNRRPFLLIFLASQECLEALINLNPLIKIEGMLHGELKEYEEPLAKSIFNKQKYGLTGALEIDKVDPNKPVIVLDINNFEGMKKGFTPKSFKTIGHPQWEVTLPINFFLR